MRLLSRDRVHKHVATVLIAALLLPAALPSLAWAAEGTSGQPGNETVVSQSASKPVDIKLSESAVEVVSRRTSHSRVFDNKDGTFVVQSSVNRLHYFDPETKQYYPANPALRVGSRGDKTVFKNGRDEYSVSLPLKVGTGEWTSIDTSSSSLAFRPASVPSGASANRGRPMESQGKQVAGRRDAIAYEGAFEGSVDLEYVSTSAGVKECIVLKQFTGVSTFVFDLVTSGLTPSLREDGSIWLTTEADPAEPAFIMPAPMMEDSEENEAGEPAFSDAVHYTLAQNADGWRLEIIAEEAWLRDPKRVYPVTIDPIVIYNNYGTYQANGYTAVEDCFVTSAYPNSNYGASFDSGYGYQLKTGYYSGAGNNRFFINPDVAWMSSYSQSLQTLGANLNLHCYWRYDHGTGPVWYGPVAEPWDEFSVTWNNAPEYDDYSCANVTQGARTRFDITPFVQAWMNGEQDPNGFAFWSRIDVVNDWTKVYARENTGIYPIFESWFTTRPQTPALSFPFGGIPCVSWTYADPEMNKPQKRAAIEVWRDGVQVASGASQGSSTIASLPVPYGGWIQGETYTIRLQTVADIVGYGGEACSDWAETEFVYAGQMEQPAATTAASAGFFQETDANGDGVNDALNDGNLAGRGSVSLSWPSVTGASGYRVYLSDGYTFRPIESIGATTWSSAGKAIFPTDSAINALPANTMTNPFVTGTGLDLRDDPRCLYAKTAGTEMDATPAYAFKVVPYNSAIEAPLTSVPTVFVSLEDRSNLLREDADHAVHELDELFEHSGNINLDEGSLQLDVTDLAIASFGPPASLSRHYSSSVETSSTFAPGWSFGFEQTLTVDGSKAVYTDAEGGQHEFAYVTTNGTATGGTKYSSGSNTVHVFSSSGALSVNGVITDASLLVVGGGGGGFTNLSGGGGGGGVVIQAGQTLAGMTNAVVGQGGGAYFSSNGGNSYFGSITAYGGGRGASRDFQGQTAGSGGSGGGGAGAMASTEANRAPGGGITGGSGGWGSPDWGVYSAGGGGGGAAGSGGGGGWGAGGMGGAGVPSALSGTFTYYGGGGGGGSYYWPGVGQAGGGQGEGSYGTGATPGAPNTGGGGGGGAVGGSGVVIVSYPKKMAWVAPSGFSGQLAPDGSGYKLTMTDGTALRFDSNGALIAEVDGSGRQVTYDRSVAGRITITAANGQRIDVELSGGKVTGATYSAGGHTREIHYGDSSVTYFPGEIDEYEIVYAYENARLKTLECPDFECSSNGPVKWEFGYAAGGQIERWQLKNTMQPFGQSNVTYSGQSAVVESPWTANSGAFEEYAWNARGQLASRTVKTGDEEWNYRYGPTGECVFEKTPSDHTVARVFDQAGNLLAETEDATHTATWTYDSANRTRTATDAGGSTTTYTYDSSSVSREPLTEQKTLGGDLTSVSYEYNANRLLTKTTESISGSAAVITEYPEFADNGQPTKTIVRGVTLGLNADGTSKSPQDLTTTKSYDAFGNLVWEKDALGQWVTKANEYSISGRLNSSTSPSDAVTHYKYDRLGGIQESWTTDGTRTINHFSQVLDPLGTVLTKTSYDGESTSTVLAIEACTTDPAGRVIKAESRNAKTALSVSHTAYDAAGRARVTWAPVAPDAVSNDETKGMRTWYDAEGKVMIEQAPDATEQTLTTYFPSGLVRQVTGADGSKTSYTYNAMGRQLTETKETQTNGVTTSATTTSVYDIGGRLVRSIDETGDDTVFTYDRLGRQLTAGLEDIPDSANTYNAAGWLLSETDSEGVATRKTYDAAGRVRESTMVAPPESAKTTKSDYDPAGRLEKTTDASGKVILYAYDAFSRVERETQRVSSASDAQIIKTVETDYDSLSRISETTATAGAAVVTRGYTYTGNTATEVTISYAGATTTVEIDPGTSTESKRTTVAEGVPTLVRTMDYDAAKRETSATIDALTYASERTFDSAGRLWTQSGSGLSGDAIYTYDAGKKSAESIPLSGGTLSSTFGYNAESRLTTVTASGAGTFAYDVAGNLTRYVTGGVPRILSYEAGHLVNMRPEGGSVETTFTYDTLGRRTAQGPSSAPGAVTYAYNDASQMTGFTGAGRSATYKYDATGQRYESVVTSGSVTTTTTSSYEGLTLLSLAASSTSGDDYSLAYLYAADGRPYAAIYSTETTAVAFSMLTTDRGDVVALLDSEGQTFASYRYDQWGRPTSTESTGTAALGASLAAEIATRQVLRYAGYAWDAESSLYYCSARYYDPATFQFLTKDIAKADAEESPYQYCSGDPVGGVDPSGMWKDTAFHYFETLAIALSMRIKLEYAKAIAAGCKFVDNPCTGTGSFWIPGPLVSPGYGYHFNTRNFRRAWRYEDAYFKADRRDSRKDKASLHLKQSKQLAKTGSYLSAAFVLGMGVHPMQDVYAHGNLVQHVLGWGLSESGSMPVDEIDTRTPWEVRNRLPVGWRANRARMATRSYIESFPYLSKLR